jgi:hypothetical protein
MNLRKIRPWVLLSRLDAGRPHLFAQNITRRFYWDDRILAGPALLVREHLSGGVAHAADRQGGAFNRWSVNISASDRPSSAAEHRRSCSAVSSRVHLT